MADQNVTVTLPCRLGDKVYGIKNRGGNLSIASGFVNEMYFVDDMKLAITIRNICRGEWGKHIFPTYEEAKAALDKLQRK